MMSFVKHSSLTIRGTYIDTLYVLRSTDDTELFLNELPYRLRMELAYKIQNKIHSNIDFFKDKPKDFVA